MPTPSTSLLQTKPIKPPIGAKPAWMQTQAATELLKYVRASGNQIWLGATSHAEGGYLLGWNSFEAATAEFSTMARLTLPGDDAKAAVFFVPGTGASGFAVGVARPPQLPGFAQRLFDFKMLTSPCPMQGRFPLVSSSLGQLLYQSVAAAVMYTVGLPSPSITFSLSGGLQR